MAGYMPAVVKVKEGLYLGSSMASSDLGFLVGNKILGIVNTCAQEVPCRWAGYGIRFSKLYLPEGESCILDTQTVESVAAFIDSVNRLGNSVLVQSTRGQSRSVAVVAAYMVLRYGLEPRAALEYVQLRRPHARVAPYLIPQVMDMVPRDIVEEGPGGTGWSKRGGVDAERRSARVPYTLDSESESSPEVTPRGGAGSSSIVDISTFKNTVRNMEGEDFVLPEALAAKVVEPGTLPNEAAGKEPDYPAGTRRQRRVSWPAERDLCQVAILRSGTLETPGRAGGERGRGASPSSKASAAAGASPSASTLSKDAGPFQRRSSAPDVVVDKRQGASPVEERATQPLVVRSGLVVQAAAAAASAASPAAVAAAVASSGAGPKVVRPGSPAILNGVGLHMQSDGSAAAEEALQAGGSSPSGSAMSPSALLAQRQSEARPSSVGSPLRRNGVVHADLGVRPSSSQGVSDQSRAPPGSPSRSLTGSYRSPLVRRQVWGASAGESRRTPQRPAFSPNTRRIQNNAGQWLRSSPSGNSETGSLRSRFRGLSISTSWEEGSSGDPGSPDMRKASAGSTPVHRPGSNVYGSSLGLRSEGEGWSASGRKNDPDSRLSQVRRNHSTLMQGTASSLRRGHGTL